MKVSILLLLFCIIQYHQTEEAKSPLVSVSNLPEQGNSRVLRGNDDSITQIKGNIQRKNMKREDKKRKNMKKEGKKRKNMKKEGKKRKNMKKENKRRRNIQKENKRRKNGEKKMKTNDEASKGLKRKIKNKKRKNQKKKGNRKQGSRNSLKKTNQNRKNKYPSKNNRKRIKSLKEKREKKTTYKTVKQQHCFNCDFEEYTKQFSTSLTQHNRAKRILKLPFVMEDYAKTNFRYAADALWAATHDGTQCTGHQDSGTMKSIRDLHASLLDCITSVPDKCNTDGLANYASNKIAATYCVVNTPGVNNNRLYEYTRGFKMSLFNQTNCDGVCGCFDYWIKPQYNYTTLEENGCLKNSFQKMNKLMLKRFSNCTDTKGKIQGSYGSCKKYIELTNYYVSLCSGDLARISQFNANVANQLLLFTDINTQLRELCKGCSAPCAACAAATYPLPPRYRIGEYPTSHHNFSAIAAALNLSTADGTACNGAAIDAETKNTYNILKNCSVSVHAICDVSKFLQNHTTESLTQNCTNIKKEFTTEYKKVIDKSKVSGSSNRTTGNSRILTGSSLEEIVQGIQNVTTDHSEPTKNLTKLMNSIHETDCLDGKYNDLEVNLKQTLQKCADATLVGSYANCVATEKLAIPLIHKCKPGSSSGSVSTPSLKKRKLFLRFK